MVLKFSSAQYDSLGRDGYLSRLTAIVREHFPRHAVEFDDDTLGRELWERTLLAHRYGLADERSAATFALTAWLLGKGFDRGIPALAQILDSGLVSPSRKARALEDFTLLLFHLLQGRPTT